LDWAIENGNNQRLNRIAMPSTSSILPAGKEGCLKILNIDH
jgi:hypothetical protein